MKARYVWALSCLLRLAWPACAAGAPPLSDRELFRLEDGYRAGTYLAMGGLLTEVVAGMTHDRGLAYGIYGASAAMRFAGLPVLARSAEALCRAGGDGPCAGRGYAYFAISLAAEAALGAELFALEYDRRRGAPRDWTHLAGAYAAAGVSTAAYLFSWYRFREVRARNAEGRVSWGLYPRPGGGGLAVRLGFGGDG